MRKLMDELSCRPRGEGQHAPHVQALFASVHDPAAAKCAAGVRSRNDVPPVVVRARRARGVPSGAILRLLVVPEAESRSRRALGRGK